MAHQLLHSNQDLRRHLAKWREFFFAQKSHVTRELPAPMLLTGSGGVVWKDSRSLWFLTNLFCSGVPAHVPFRQLSEGVLRTFTVGVLFKAYS